MNSLLIAAVAFAATAGGAALGMFLRSVLPEGHLRQESKEVILLGSGLIATMAALVLGLLVATATSDFAEQSRGLQSMSTDIVVLDKVLAHYGPDADPARRQLAETVGQTLARRWPQSDAPPTFTDSATAPGAHAIVEAVRGLKPHDDAQRALQQQALQIAAELARTRWLLTHPIDNSIPMPFLVVLGFWLLALFASFGLFAPRNSTVVVVLLLCALSVSGALLLIVDLDQPFDGLIRMSDAPLREARAQLGK